MNKEFNENARLTDEELKEVAGGAEKKNSGSQDVDKKKKTSPIGSINK